MPCLRKPPVFFALLTSLLLLVPAPLRAATVSISAAASLKEVINELCSGYAARYPAIRFTNNYGASGMLAKQIEQGAPADIYISANGEWMEYLQNRGLADRKSIATLAYNALVFTGRPDLKTAGIQDVVKLARIAIGSPKSVPAGEYAMAALRKAGIDRQLERKLVMARDVRECLMYVERGEVDGAFIYRTDAMLMAGKATILFTVPQDLYPRVNYPMALTSSGARNSAAAAFIAFLKTTEAKTVLTKHGFQVR